MSIFERYLSLWVILCMGVGVALGQMVPALVTWLSHLSVYQVNLPIGLFIWLMIVPMLIRVDFRTIPSIFHHWRGMGVTLLINWAIKPFSMALLAWFFVDHLFAAWLPADQLASYRAGLILLAAAPCTAMVFVWSRLANGHPLFTLSQVALNDLIMVVVFAPLVALLLGVSDLVVPWPTLWLSVVLYIVVPLIGAQWLRQHWLRRGAAVLDSAMARLTPWSTAALLLMLVLLFAFQGQALIQQPITMALLAVPIVLQVFFTSSLAYWLNRQCGESHEVACPSALIGASNFFELSVAVAISLFGLHSGATLATVVGVLVEVPAMLAVVWVVKRSKNWYERVG